MENKEVKKVIKNLIKKGSLSKTFDPWVDEEKKVFDILNKDKISEITVKGIKFKIERRSGGGAGMGEYPPTISLIAVKIIDGYKISKKKSSE